MAQKGCEASQRENSEDVWIVPPLPNAAATRAVGSNDITIYSKQEEIGIILAAEVGRVVGWCLL